jgi:hypothetical protein
MDVLRAVRRLTLPQGFVAAGFVRNLVWDHLHHQETPSNLNDIDVIYFDSTEQCDDQHQYYERVLLTAMPDVNWQVRNQARMHIKNKDRPYQNVQDAMSYWPEKETAIAVRLTSAGNIDCITAFDLSTLFALQITHNPRRDKLIFEQRVNSKNWLTQWPKLTVND